MSTLGVAASSSTLSCNASSEQGKNWHLLSLDTNHQIPVFLKGAFPLWMYVCVIPSL